MRPGWNPTKRNRNIGTEKQGHGADNRLVIPQAWPEDRVFYEVLESPAVLCRQFGQHEIVFLVEPVTSGFTHACTVDDICEVLATVPYEHLLGIDLIILRQPTRKQAHLSAVWGRLVYYAETNGHHGTAIYLEAQQQGQPIRWKRSLQPDGKAELDRLRADGHRIEDTKREHIIWPNLESTRATQLYRTLVHEVGHLVDWWTSVLQPSFDSDDPDENLRRERAYKTKPPKDKEAFANRYADEHGAHLRAANRIPFPRKFDSQRIKMEGMDPSWFSQPPP